MRTHLNHHFDLKNSEYFFASFLLWFVHYSQILRDTMLSLIKEKKNSTESEET